MKLLWSSDLHFDWIVSGPDDRSAIDELAETWSDAADGIVITGDISTGGYVASDILRFQEVYGKPVYFVLGNHDYYYSSFDIVQKQLSSTPVHLNYLQNKPCVIGDTTIVGVDGWYDGLSGVINDFRMTDFRVIHEFAEGSGSCPETFDDIGDYWLWLSRKKARQSANLLAAQLASVTTPNVLVATHVPPFPELCRYNGQPSEPEYLPFYTNTTLGFLLDGFASKNPDKKIMVLSGHTHSEYCFYKRENLISYVAEAEYGSPQIHALIDLESMKIDISEAIVLGD